MDRNKMRRLANALEIEYDGDLCELYANVSNRIAGHSEADEALLALKREIEHRITLEVMEEYSWERMIWAIGTRSLTRNLRRGIALRWIEARSKYGTEERRADG